MTSRVLVIVSWVCVSAVAVAQGPRAIATDGMARSVSVSADGKLVAAHVHPARGGPGHIGIYDAQTGQTVRKIPFSRAAVLSHAFSPDGKWFAMDDDKGGEATTVVRLFDAQTWEEKPSIATQRLAHAPRFSPDGKLIYLSSAKSADDYLGDLIVWDLERGAEKQLLDLPALAAAYPAFSSDGKLVAHSVGAHHGKNAGVHLRDTGTLKLKAQLSVAVRPNEGVGVAFSPIETLIAVSTRDLLLLWRPDQRQSVTLGKFYHASHCLAFSPDGELLACGGRGETQLTLWNVKTGLPDRVLDHPYGILVMDAAFAPDGKYLATVSFNRTGDSLFVWDLAFPQERRSR